MAWAIEKATGERLESAPVTMEMAVNEGWFGKNGSKWKSMPDLMMRYRRSGILGLIYAPELLMGLPTAEEMHDVFSVDADGTVTEGGKQSVPRTTGNIDPATGEVRATGLQPYTDDQFAKNLPAMACRHRRRQGHGRRVIAGRQDQGHADAGADGRHSSPPSSSL